MVRTHIERLPEYYETKYKEQYENLDWNWLKEISFKRRLLVIDDEPNIRSSYSRILLNEGFHVLVASNANEANEILVNQPVDIVLLDINMAEVDGGTLFELIRNFHNRVKVVVSSVCSIDEQKEKIKEADAYFDKSDGKNILLGIIYSL